MTAPVFDGTQACAGADLDLFFPNVGATARVAVRQAKGICARCRFQAPCLEYAVWAQGVSGRYVSGVWGGTSEGERAQIRKTQRSAA